MPTAIETGTSTATTKGATTTTQAPTTSAPTGDTPSSAAAVPTETPPTSSITESPAASNEPSEQPKLSSAQIAGITLGCAAVLVLGVLLVVLARCLRRKRLGDTESGFSKMRDSMSFGKSRPNSAPGLQISSPIARIPAAERNPMDMRWQGSQPNLQQGGGGFGLAITPFGAGPVARPSPAPVRAVPAAASDPTPAPAPAPAPAPVPAQRPIPKLVLSPPPKPKAPAAERSPPKPALTLAIPKGSEPVVRMPASGRDSVVTEFAEDGEGDIAPGTAIWRPPPRDPQSATTYYFADKGGNWVLRNSLTRKTEAETSRQAPAPTGPIIQEAPSAPFEIELPSPEHKTRAERARDAYGGFSPDAVVSPLRLPQKPAHHTKLGSPIAFKDQRREPRLSRPDPGARLSLTAETIGREPVPAKSQPPDTYFAMIREARDLTGGKTKRRSTRKARRRVSEDSTTSIESAAAAPFEDEDIIEDEPQVDLSPVAESPSSPLSPGKSPVKYPKISKRSDGQWAAAPAREPESNLLPPAHRYNIWHPPGRSSPTGESVLPKPRVAAPPAPQQNGPSRPWNAPNLNPNRNPAQQRTGSPATRPGPGPVSPIEQEYWQHRQQVANPTSYWNRPQNAPPPRARPPPPASLYELAGENSASRRYQTPPQQHQQRRLTRPPQLPTPQRTPQQPAPAARAGDTSSQSSLLAQRRGADKIAALSLGNGIGNDAMRRKTKPGGWAKHDSLVGPVPITPGWVPELTPTRRGEDLYLNVR